MEKNSYRSPYRNSLYPHSANYRGYMDEITQKQRIEKFIWKFRNMAFCYRYAFMGVRLKYRHTNQS